MAEIVISEFMDDAAVEALRADFDVLYDPALVDDRPRLLDAVGGAAGLIVRNRTQVDTGLLERAAGLRVVGRLGVGLDNIDLDACKGRDVAVYPATGANATAVAEYVMTAAAMLVRGAYRASTDVIAGAWPRTQLIGGELAGRTMGLVGLGQIAREVARRAAAFDMTLTAHDPFVATDDPVWDTLENLDLDDLLARSDVISLHVPLTPDTHGLIRPATIARMKATAVVVNTARGGVVDEAAVVAALCDGRLGGAALDVFAQEPLTTSGATAFARVPNLLLTPHIAGVTEEANVRVSAVTAENVRRHLSEAR